MDRRTVLTVSIIAFTFLIGLSSGLVLNYTKPSFIFGPDDTVVQLPEWEDGRWWIYSFTTPELNNEAAKMGVAYHDEQNYMVGAAYREDAQMHAVLNYNPVLGRIAIDELGVYEKGVPEILFDFPLERDKTWTFSLFDVETFTATVTGISTSDTGSGSRCIVHILAESADSSRIVYTYDSSARWIGELTFTDSTGQTALEMKHLAHGTGYSGTLYFIRATDLFDKNYRSFRGSPDLELYDTFLDSGHKSSGPFDSLIYYYTVDTGDSAGGSFTLRDHQSITAVRRIFGPNTHENTLGSTPSVAGEWTVTATLFGDSSSRLRISGGIEYVWTVK